MVLLDFHLQALCIVPSVRGSRSRSVLKERKFWREKLKTTTTGTWHRNPWGGGSPLYIFVFELRYVYVLIYVLVSILHVGLLKYYQL